MADKKISALTAATTPLAGTEVLPIVQSGATVKVSIADVTAGRAVSATSIAAGLGAVGTPAYTFTGDTNTGMWSPAADTIAFSEGGAEAMRIDSSGNLLVGTTTALTFATNTNQGSQLGPNIILVSRNSGVGLNVQLTGADGGCTRFWRDNAVVGTISLTALGTVYGTTSDIRLKKNVAPADDAAALIDALQVRKFNWIVDNSAQRYGFVAQELLEIAPEAVSVPDDKNELMCVDYSKLVPMMVKEIQSLRVRVAQLEKN
jgi:hypothetical protein